MTDTLRNDHVSWSDDIAMIFQHCYQRAYHRGLADRIPTIFALWSVLRWEQRLFSIILLRLGVDVRKLEETVREHVDGLPHAELRGELDSTEIEQLRACSKLEAELMTESIVGTEHLLLALCRSEDPAVLRALKKYNVDYEAVLNEINQLRR